MAPNIYYLGFAGVINVNGVRIGGLSGIYNEHHYSLGHFERPPFDDKAMRSFYHMREFEVFQMSQITKPVDVFLSHDWPRGIAYHGDKEDLLRKKKFLRKEVTENSLGEAARNAK